MPKVQFGRSLLKFTPLEFETSLGFVIFALLSSLKFTPLEFETNYFVADFSCRYVKIYSVGV